jgi:ferric-dicitrate binding protein FerR (iron transport regulator)
MQTQFTEPEQLLADESFLSWYFRGEGDWDVRIKHQPQLARLVEEASALLETIRVREERVSDQRRQDAEEALFRKIDALQPVPPIAVPLHPPGTIEEDRRARRNTYGRWTIAAAVLVLLAGAVVLTVRMSGDRQLTTAFGQLAERQLPDGTEVTLDANSRLTYPTGWKDGADREVWVSGEAFFHVRKTPSKSRFIVHTDHFDVIVTGTRFNVVNRHGDENVLLQEGSVILLEKDGKEMELRPGDFVRFHVSGAERSDVKTDSVIAWKDQKLVFNRTPLRELVNIVNDHYGVNLQLENPSLGDSTVTAILPNNNLDVLLQSLEATSEFDIIRKDDQIKIVAHQGQHQ